MSYGRADGQKPGDEIIGIVSFLIIARLFLPR